MQSLKVVQDQPKIDQTQPVLFASSPQTWPRTPNLAEFVCRSGTNVLARKHPSVK